MAPKRSSRGKQKLDLKKIEEDIKSCQYDQLKEIDTSLVGVVNKLVDNILENGGEINPAGMRTSSY